MQEDVEKIAHELRIDIAKLFFCSGTGHMAPALSCIDILTALYFGGVADLDKRFGDSRDRVILSKGHACAALYVVLARLGYFPREELWTFYKRNSRLGGHPNIALSGIETATGALGHGICFATGTAKAAKMSGKDFRTYVIVGDGELQEGSVWEAAEFATNQKLDNLTVIVDRNRLQASDWVDDIAPIDPLVDKWKSFGWHAETVDGHDIAALIDTLTAAKLRADQPTVLIANTIKGKGISLAENSPNWHSRAPKKDEWRSVCEDLKITMEELQSL